MARDPKSPSLKKPNPKSSAKSSGSSPDNSVRLNKWLSECGISSRRKADELITEGAVQVNGKKVYELGTRIVPNEDRITVNGKPIKAETRKIYIMFNKPRNVVTTMNDPEGRPSISDFFTRLPVRVFPVGRLDWDTEGLILLTNDGEFSQKVNHPSKEIFKTYMAKISGRPSPQALERLRTGVSIPGGRVTAKYVERISRGGDQYDWIKLSIAEGKNRQIRYMFEKIGFDVMKLQRVSIGQLKMPSSLKRGEFVFLTEKGLAKIFEGDKRDLPPLKHPGEIKRDPHSKKKKTSFMKKSTDPRKKGRTSLDRD
ncbi:MAG: pseudouridine synthase [Bdellovibrionota bacterium]